MRSRPPVAVWGVGLVLLTGCPSVSALGLARPLRSGSAQTVVALGALGLRADSGSPSYGTQLEAAFRFGVTDSLELSAKVWPVGLGAEAKIGLLRSPTMDSGLDVSLAPGLAYWGIIPTNTIPGVVGSYQCLTLNLPLLIGLNLGGSQLVLAPRVSNTALFTRDTGTGAGPEEALNLGGVGGTVGYAVRMGKGLYLLPEVAITAPVLGPIATARTRGLENAAYLTMQASLSLLFGGEYERPLAPATP